jgi:hypothetical protein
MVGVQSEGGPMVSCRVSIGTPPGAGGPCARDLSYPRSPPARNPRTVLQVGSHGSIRGVTRSQEAAGFTDTYGCCLRFAR